MDKVDVGVIVGRFQNELLHEGHKALITKASKMCKKLYIFVGIAPVKMTFNNPLNFNMVYDAIRNSISEVATILPLMDTPTDDEWNNNLNDMISKISMGGSVKLFGSRESFMGTYDNKYPTQGIPCEININGPYSATKERADIHKDTITSNFFRRGVIWATGNRYYNALPTVDVALWFSESRSSLVMARKPNEKKFRFIGGFVDVGETYEDAAIRETKEESGAIIKNPQYISSVVVDDWRYRHTNQKITTSFFEAVVENEADGSLRANDDIAELVVISFDKLTNEYKDLMVSTHWPLMEKLIMRRGKPNE